MFELESYFKNTVVWYEVLVSKLIKEYADSKPSDGQLHVTDSCVCEANTGYYIGTWCIEYMGDGDTWLPQPHSRDSEYFPTITTALNSISAKRVPTLWVDKKRKFSLDTTQFYVGRPSALGNPFVMKDESQRTTVCEQYHEWLSAAIKNRNPDVLRELNTIVSAMLNGEDCVLVCYCAPKRCHAESIAKVVANAYAKHIIHTYNEVWK